MVDIQVAKRDIFVMRRVPSHEDVRTWNLFPQLLPFGMGIPRSSVVRSLMFSVLCSQPKEPVQNSRDASDFKFERGWLVTFTEQAIHTVQPVAGAHGFILFGVILTVLNGFMLLG